jgi:hypothetical protein
MAAVPERPDEPSLRELAERLGETSGRRIPLLVLGLAAIVIGLVILTFQLDSQRQRAERAAGDARADAAEAKQARQVAEQARRETEAALNDKARILGQAKEALRLGQWERLAELLKDSLTEAESDAQGVRSGTAGWSTPVPQADTIRPTRTFDLPGATGSYRQRVFIQFAGLIQRPDIAALNRALAAGGWNVQGRDGERVGRAAGLNEVRYFADEDREAAIELARVLTMAGLGSRDVVAKRVARIVPGTLEAWISNS